MLDGFHSFPGYLPPGTMTTGGYITPSLVCPKITVILTFSFFPPPVFAIGTLFVPLKS